MAHQQPCAPSLRGFAPGTRQIITVIMPTQTRSDPPRRRSPGPAIQSRTGELYLSRRRVRETAGLKRAKEFTAAALPLVQTALREALGDVWCQAGVSWAGGNPLARVTPNGPVGLASRQGLLFLPKNVKRR